MPEKKIALVVDEWGACARTHARLERRLVLEQQNTCFAYDPRRAVRIRIASGGQKNETLRGETLAAPKIDSVNTFEAPNTVAPKSVTAKRTGGVMTLELAPASVTVVSLGP